MPRGKELEQLPMSNVASSFGDDQAKTNRTSLTIIHPLYIKVILL
ncbi:hypothetical protein NST61_09655 [Caldifermentibacillus hisashii]